MKKLCLALSLAAGALLFAGCRSCEEEAIVQQIARELDQGGTLYFIADQTQLLGDFCGFARDVNQGIQESEALAPRLKSGIGKGVAAGLDSLKELGVAGEIGFGASSVAFRFADCPKEIYRNRFFYCHGNRETPGALWALGGVENRDLTDSIRAIPDNALLAADFLFQPDELIATFRRIEREIRPEQPSLLNPMIEDAIRNVSGNWAILVTDDAVGMLPVSFLITIPDPGAKIFNQVAALTGNPPMTAPGKGSFAMFELPAPGNLPMKPLLQHSEDQLILFSSTDFAGKFGTSALLADAPEYRALAHRLPTQGLGFLYTGGDIGKLLANFAAGLGLKLPIDLPPQFTVWEKTPNGVLGTQNSRWDINHWQLAMQFAPAAVALAQPLSRIWSTLDGDDGEEAEKPADGRNYNEVATARQDAQVQAQMETVYAALRSYAAKRGGAYPAAADIDGLRELLKTTKLTSAPLIVPPQQPDELPVEPNDFSYDNCSFIYFSGHTEASAPNLPLLIDWPYNGRGSFNVLFVDGSRANFALENVSNCRRVVSFLHSRFKYSEADYNRLLATATKLDRAFAE